MTASMKLFYSGSEELTGAVPRELSVPLRLAIGWEFDSKSCKPKGNVHWDPKSDHGRLASF